MMSGTIKVKATAGSSCNPSQVFFQLLPFTINFLRPRLKSIIDTLPVKLKRHITIQGNIIFLKNAMAKTKVATFELQVASKLEYFCIFISRV